MNRITFVYGTRPEAIKIKPVLNLLSQPYVIFTGQQKHLGSGFFSVDHDLEVMTKNQTPNQLVSKIVKQLEPLLAKENPRVVVVQGDTTSALAGALCAASMKIPVAHIEAGLRTYETNPHPEEMNRRIISSLATYHFCPTQQNMVNLQNEGVFTNPKVRGAVTGSTSIDALRTVFIDQAYQRDLDDKYWNTNLLLFTMHRRENIEDISYFTDSIDRFMKGHDDNFLCVWPVHPNPKVQKASKRFEKSPHWCLTPPMTHDKLIQTARHSWAILSDSGGIQEEITVIKRPLIILRQSTERPEVLALNYVDLVWPSIEVHLEDWWRRLRSGHFLFSKDSIYSTGAAAKIISVLCTV